MSDAYCGEIRMFGGAFAPVDWAFCNGQIMQVNDNQVLYSLIGNIWGGSPPSTFALPDLRGRLPVHQGQGTGLTNRVLAQSFGTETVTLTAAQLPAHNHPMQASTNAGTTSTPSATVVLAGANATDKLYDSTTDATKINALAADAVTATTGGGQSHGNLMPALCISFIICLRGMYPQRAN